MNRDEMLQAENVCVGYAGIFFYYSETAVNSVLLRSNVSHTVMSFELLTSFYEVMMGRSSFLAEVFTIHHVPCMICALYPHVCFTVFHPCLCEVVYTRDFQCSFDC